MGITGLLTSTIELIGSITNFGLGSSAVRDVSVAVTTGNEEKVRTTVSILRRLVWITGLLGTLITIFLSPFLSELAFGNKDYTIAFISISITLLLSQLSAGQLVVLQGLRKLKYLAKANLAGMLIGLLISIPIYYKLGIKGIVPAIIISSFLTLFFSWYYSSKVHIAKINVDKSIFKSESIAMLKLGFMLSVSGLISVSASYILKIFIGRTGGIEQVGFYNAGFAIINTYVGMIFTAMMTDYYPRLAEVSSDNDEAKNVINEQAEIAILIIAPILVGFITFIKWAIILLYSNEFIVVNSMLHWAALGMFFKTVSWAIGIVFLAKGASSMFFWNELIANIYLLLLNIFGYKLFGLNGLGISFLVGYILFFLQVFIAAKINYAFSFADAFYKLFIIQFLFGLLCFITMEKITPPFSYLAGLVFIFLSTGYSYIELNKRLDLNQILLSLVERIRNTN
jgi:O-antigen/teichoic acid export membrane protein